MIAVVRIVLLGQLADTSTHCFTTFAVLNDIAIRKPPFKLLFSKFHFPGMIMGQIKKQSWESIIINPKTGFKTRAVSHQWKWHLNWMQIGWILTMKNNQWQIALGDLFLEKNRRDFCFRKFSHQTANCYNFWKLSNIFFAHSRIFKDHDPNSRTFQGLEFFFPNSRTFQDFQGPWQPCV